MIWLWNLSFRLFCLSVRVAEVMDAMVYVDQENGTLAPLSIKATQRLQSAPGKLKSNLTFDEMHFFLINVILLYCDWHNCSFIERLLKTPLKPCLRTPAQSGRKALGPVNKMATLATSHKSDLLNKPLAAQVGC